MILKDIHIATAMVSIFLFCIRFYWVSIGSDLIKIKVVKIFPHLNDSILLISAIFLAMNLSQYPFYDDWLSVKVIALLLYIFLGVITLKRARTNKIRNVAGFSAIFVFAFIVSVAMSKSTIGFFTFLYVIN